jgi:hypothetical protein
LDGLTFTASVIKAVVWPLTVIALAWKFHRPLGNLIEKISKIVVGDKIQIDIGQAVKDIESQAEKTLPPMPTEAAPAEEDGVAELATILPRQALVLSWIDVECALLRLAKRRGMRIEEPVLVARILFQRNIIEPAVYAIFAKLRALYDRVQPDSTAEIAPGQALEFRALSLRLIAKLDSL